MFMPCCWVDEKECWKYVLGQEAIVLQNNSWKKAFCALNWRSEGPSVDLFIHDCISTLKKPTSGKRLYRSMYGLHGGVYTGLHLEAG